MACLTPCSELAAKLAVESRSRLFPVKCPSPFSQWLHLCQDDANMLSS